MGEIKNRKRFGCTLELKSWDTLQRVSNETMVDKTKIVNKALNEYFERNGIEIRLNTPEEQEKIDSGNNK